MQPPHQENLRVLAIILIIFWLTTSSGDGQAGYFATPFLTQERLARQRHSHSVLNSTTWGDFNPRQQGDPPNGTEHTRYINITGFRQGDGLAWEDLGLFRQRCLETSRSTSPLWSKPIAEGGGPVLETGQDEGSPASPKSAWDMLSSPTWLNATGLVRGSWTRREASSPRTWSDYNFTAMTPGISWSGTHGEWNRNVTGSEGTMQLRIEDKKRHMEYEEDIGDEHHRLSTGGSVREVAAGLIIEDSAHDGSGSQYEMRLHGVHWPAQGNMLLTTTSEKFAGIFGLPHLTPDESFFESSKQLLNQTIHEVLSKKEKSAFTDQSNPWTSSATGMEESWNPSPHCEWVVYLQVHPLTGNDLQRSEKDIGDVVREIENELRYPTGAPLPRVPDMRLSAVLYSPDCAYFLESKGPPHFPEAQGNHLVGFKEEVWISNLNFYLLVMAAIVFGQVHLLKSQMRESYTPSTMGRVSFWTIAIMVLVDGMMFTVAAALSLDSPFFLRALVLTFALFMSMMIGGSFLGEIYKIQESEWRPRQRESTPNNTTPRPPSTPAAPQDSLPLPVTASTAAAANPPIIIPFDQDIDAEIAENTAAGAAAAPAPGTTGTGAQQSRVTQFSSIIGRLFLAGSCISFLSLAATSWWRPLRSFYVNTMVFAYMSLWVPQIIRNMYRNSGRAFSWRFVIGQSVLRILPVAYFYLRKRNVIFAETDWKAFLIVAGWLWSQLWVLAFQGVLGPRFGMPKGWMPEAWDYHLILREDNLEAGGLPIGLVPSTSTPGSPTLERVRSLSLSSVEGREKSTTAVKGMRIRAIECAICQEVLEVPVVKAGHDVEPAGGGVAGVLERRKYMVTPCRHIFHSTCLEGWLRFRLQCPNCREDLPPL
jgi:transmembrane E3 ubiquitin-protein ligase